MPKRGKSGTKVPPKKTETASKKKEAPKTTSVVDDSSASITYHISFTKNMGNYESMKIEAGLTLPVNFTNKMLDDAMEKAEVMRDKLTERLMEDLDDIKK